MSKHTHTMRGGKWGKGEKEERSSSSKFYHLAAALASQQRPPWGVRIKTLQTPVAHSLSLFLFHSHSLLFSLSLMQSASTAHSLLWQGNTITIYPHTRTHTHRETFCLVFSPGHQLSQVSHACHRLWTALVLVLVLVLLLVLQSTGQRMCVSRFKSKLSRTRHGRTGSGSGNELARHSVYKGSAASSAALSSVKIALQ